jgi:excisionase family DNA binding protein
MEHPEKILTTQRVADYCKVSKRRVWAAVRKGELEYLDFGTLGKSRTRRFTRAAVERWLASISSQKSEGEIIL